MKKSLFISFFILFLFCLFTCSCEKRASSPFAEFSAGQGYVAAIKIEGFESKGEFFFDEENRLHLLHTDPTSPLFGMEEIFDDQKIKTIFENLQYEKEFSENGTALIKSIFDVIQAEDGKKVTENGAKITKYVSEEYSFSLSSSKENPKEKTIQGTGWNSEFNITFLPKA